MNDPATATLPQPHADHVRVAAERWEGVVAPRVLYYDRYRNRYCTSHSRPTRRALHGRAPYRWLRTARNMAEQVWSQSSLRRWQSIGAPALALPEDAIIMPRKRGVTVIASAAEGRVIKLSSTPGTARLIVNEGKAWELAKDAGIEAHIPRIFDSGRDAETTYWISSQLAPNHFPFWERLRGVWRRWLAREGLPVLQRFYSVAGVTTERTGSRLKAIRSESNQGDARGISALVAEARESAGDSIVYQSLTHGDLTPIHIHRTRSQWTLIDWAKLGKRSLWMEFFAEYLRYPTSTRYQRPAFWRWLRGDCSAHALPPAVRKDIELYLTWINRWQPTHQDPDDLRYQILLRLYTPLKRARQMRERASDTAQASDAAVPYPTHTEQIASALHLR